MVTSGAEFNDGDNGANLNLAYSSQSPVNYFKPTEKGHHDVTGNLWEWTEDHFNPLEGFEVHHVYDGFSTLCFDGKHSMIVGGSFISTGDVPFSFPFLATFRILSCVIRRDRSRHSSLCQKL